MSTFSASIPDPMGPTLTASKMSPMHGPLRWRSSAGRTPEVPASSSRTIVISIGSRSAGSKPLSAPSRVGVEAPASLLAIRHDVDAHPLLHRDALPSASAIPCPETPPHQYASLLAHSVQPRPPPHKLATWEESSDFSPMLRLPVSIDSVNRSPPQREEISRGRGQPACPSNTTSTTPSRRSAHQQAPDCPSRRIDICSTTSSSPSRPSQAWQSSSDACHAPGPTVPPPDRRSAVQRLGGPRHPAPPAAYLPPRAPESPNAYPRTRLKHRSDTAVVEP